MDRFKELISIAEAAGCASEAVKAERQASTLLAQDEVKIVVTGMRNSGKTTLINEMAGVEVWKPGNMDDEEQPIRVGFKPLPEDSRYNCIMAVNNSWNEKDAVLFELREDDILRDGELTDNMADKDIVLFLISAMAPFNVEQVKMLKALSPFYRMVIITNMASIRESERGKVLQYIEKFRISLDLPPVIIWEEGQRQDIGRIVRNALPACMDMEQLRTAHCNAIFMDAAKKIERGITDAIALVRQQAELAGQNQEAEWEAKKEKSDWYTLRTDLQERKNKTVKKVIRGLKEEDRAIASRLMKEGHRHNYDNEWVKSVQQNAVKEFKKVVQSRADKLVKAFAEDMGAISASAELFGLTGYNKEEFIQLERDIVGELASDNMQSITSVTQIDMQADKSGSIKILLGTGAILGGCIVAPLPSIVCWAGGAAALGIGIGSYLKQQHIETASAIENSVRENIHSALGRVEGYILDAADTIYGKAADYIERCEEKVSGTAVDLTPYEDKEQLLNNLLVKVKKLGIAEE